MIRETLEFLIVFLVLPIGLVATFASGSPLPIGLTCLAVFGLAIGETYWNKPRKG